MAKSFLEYDTDDGRSSKLCQNEEDDEYYGKLEIEYKSKIHRIINFENQEKNDVAKDYHKELILTENINLDINIE